jgi:DNA-directed RNA polymerase specialized sigma24 family protein
MADAERFAELVAIGKRLAELGDEIRELFEERTVLVRELHARGYSHRNIAADLGVSRGRVFQILKAGAPSAAHEDGED